MRLSTVERGHRWPDRLLLGVMRIVTRMEPPDMLKALRYRPEFFGRPYSAVRRAVMQGVSDWTPGERQLFAAFVSRLNQCPS